MWKLSCDTLVLLHSRLHWLLNQDMSEDSNTGLLLTYLNAKNDAQVPRRNICHTVGKLVAVLVHGRDLLVFMFHVREITEASFKLQTDKYAGSDVMLYISADHDTW